MNYRELKRLIQKGESQTVDFKKTITHVYKIAKTICSFANTRGGKILVGVQDNKMITGIDPEEEMYLIGEAAAHYAEPPVDVSFQKVEDDEGRIVLVATIPESGYKPHRSLDDQGNWQVYVRLNDKSILAGKSMLRSLSASSAKRNNMQVLVKFAKHEKILLTYLKEHERITLKQFIQLTNISERRARRSLHRLIQEGVLLVHELEKEPFYGLS